MTLYLKYRPKTLEELDLSEVRETLQRIVKSGKIPHAFLFSGPRGLGKTSAARILAKTVNCEHPTKTGEPCNRCKQCKAIIDGSHLDIIELDAASHRGIDDVRALREAVKLAPSMATKKVYIIDEAHMLTLEASNALLKTLEEPPNHVMFILATTNPEKLIETIRSRAVNIVFKKAAANEVLRSLKRVVKGEKLKIKDEVLIKIVDASGGSFRDAVKILESMTIKGSKLEESLLAGDEAEKLLLNIFKKDAKAALTEIDKIVRAGVSIDFYIQKIIGRLREALLAEMGIGENKLEEATPEEIVSFIKKLVGSLDQMRNSPIEHLPLEIAVVEWCASKTEDSRQEGGQVKLETQETIETTSKKKEVEQAVVDIRQPITDLENDTWAKILSTAHPRNRSVEALLKAARPINFDGKILTLGVFYSFHKERLESSPHRQILDEIVNEVFGKEVRVVCTLAKPTPQVVENVRVQEGVVLTESADTTGDILTKDQSQDIIKLAKEIFGN